MLFNSPEFILGLLPLAFVGFALFSLLRLPASAKLWLVLISLVFYSWWRPANLPVLLLSVLVNYALGGVLLSRPSKMVLALGIAFNCVLLGYFKYTVFVVSATNGLFDTQWTVPEIILPLAISFYTFQQIAYLVDANAARVERRNFLDYCLFISFFPQLIAGPITHHREMLSQFDDPDRFRPRWDLVAMGLTLFLIGLFKKVMVADPFGETVGPIFGLAEAGGVQFVQAWTGALSYALQMYFDFSGYSDMAIGLGLLFGIALPLNFNSPYKARNIIEFWSRWHMTLTRFLTGYIYNPLVVFLTRRRAARHLPLPRRGAMTVGTFATLVAGPTLLTMFVSGVWHGAGWQFVAFGLLHGLFLIVAHGWRGWKAHRGVELDRGTPLTIAGSVLLTFLCATVALVFFRAASVGGALDMLRGMVGLNGVALPPSLAGVPLLGHVGVTFERMDGIGALQFARIALFLAVVWTLPNAIEWLHRYEKAFDFRSAPTWLLRRWPLFSWRPGPTAGTAMGVLSMLTLLYAFSAAPSEFLYFQF